MYSIALFKFLAAVHHDSDLAENTVYQLRKDLQHKMKTVPISVMTHIVMAMLCHQRFSDMDNIASTLQQSLAQMVTSAVMLRRDNLDDAYDFLEVNADCIGNDSAGLNCCGDCRTKIATVLCRPAKALGLLNNQVEETYGGQVIITEI